MNTTNSSDVCGFTLGSLQPNLHRDTLSIVVFFALGVCCSVFGLCGNALSFFAMRVLHREMKAFLLQLHIVSVDFLLNFFNLLVILFFYILRLPSNLAPRWMLRSYLLVAWAACLSNFVWNVLALSSLLLVLSFTAHRLYALLSPLNFQVYADQWPGRLVFLIYVLSFALNCGDLFASEIIYCAEQDQYIDHYIYPPRPITQALWITRTFVHVLSLLALAVLFVLVVRAYKKSEQTRRNLRRSAPEQPVAAEVLQKLLAVQALTLTAGYWPLNILYLLVTFGASWATLTYPYLLLCDALMYVSIGFNFLFYLFTSKKFRTAVRNLLPCLKNQVGASNNQNLGMYQFAQG